MAKNKITAKDRKGKVKDVYDMSNAKKKLHEMVEALIGGDSKAAAAALHEYLQQKTRTILGEEHGDMDMDMGDEHEDFGGEGDEFGGEDEFDGEGDDEECEHCHGEGCEHCEHDDEGSEFDDEDGEEADFGDEHGDMDHDDEFEPMHEANTTMATKQSKDMHKNRAKDLDYKVKGDVKFKGSGKGAKLTKPFNNAAPHLDRKVKGKLNFEKSSGVGTKKQNTTEATPTFKGAHNNAAKDLGRKVKGNIKFSKSKANKNT